MLKGTGEEREGALLRRLKEAGHGARPGGFGFATGGEGGAKRRAMVVVARVAYAKTPDALKSASSAGAAAVEIAVERPRDAEGLAAAVAAAGLPCGVYIDGDGDWSAITEIEGLDWIHLGPQAPARLLAGKGATRLVSLSTGAPPGRLPGLSALKADAVVVHGSGVGAGAFTLDALLALRTIQGATQRPVLAGDGLGLAPDDVETLHDQGIEGLLIADSAALPAFVAAVEKL